jgi:hypothetical protein
MCPWIVTAMLVVSTKTKTNQARSLDHMIVGPV